MHQVVQNVIEYVMDAFGHDARGHRHAGDALRRMGAVAPDGSRAQRSPNQAFGDVEVAGIEGVQVRMRLPLLEQLGDILPINSIR